MWKDRRPGFVQAVIAGVFVIFVLVLFLLSSIARHQNRPTMQIYHTQQEFTDDFGGDAADWQSVLFAWNENARALTGAVPVGQGHGIATHARTFRNLHVEVEIKDVVIPRRGVVSTGVMCRATRDGDGYYFLVSHTGLASIRVGEPGADDLAGLVNWRAHPAIRPLETSNTISAACVEDYLAMYINGSFFAEVYDERFERGHVGVTLAASDPEDEGGDVTANFDNVTVSQAVARQ
jgi:hypothetical protein